jgi:hypothetical protein
MKLNAYTATLIPEPPEASTVKTLTLIAGILSLIFGIVLLIFGVITLIVLVGIIYIVIGIIDILIYTNCNAIRRLVNERRYEEAKSKTLVWMILGFIFGGIIVGVLLLVAYLKYDDLIRHSQPAVYQPPPPPG